MEGKEKHENNGILVLLSGLKTCHLLQEPPERLTIPGHCECWIKDKEQGVETTRSLWAEKESCFKKGEEKAKSWLYRKMFWN